MTGGRETAVEEVGSARSALLSFYWYREVLKSRGAARKKTKRVLRNVRKKKRGQSGEEKD